MNKRHWGIRAKLLGGFVLVLVIALAQSLLSIHRLHAVNAKSTDLAGVWLPSVKQLGDLGTELGTSRVTLMKLLLVENPMAVDAIEAEMKRGQQRLDKHRAAYAADFSSAEDKALYEQFDRQLKAAQALNPELFKMMREMRTDEARQLGREHGPERRACVTEARADVGRFQRPAQVVDRRVAERRGG